MAGLNTRSFSCYCGSCSAERAVTSVLRSAVVKKVVPILSTRVEKVFLCLAAILNLRNVGLCVLFIMAKRHPVRNSQFMKAIRDVHYFFQEESFNIRNIQPV
jgi:3-deoxy-D-manno-octulosonic-acid transferase